MPIMVSTSGKTFFSKSPTPIEAPLRTPMVAVQKHPISGRDFYYSAGADKDSSFYTPAIENYEGLSLEYSQYHL